MLNMTCVNLILMFLCKGQGWYHHIMKSFHKDSLQFFFKLNKRTESIWRFSIRKHRPQFDWKAVICSTDKTGNWARIQSYQKKLLLIINIGGKTIFSGMCGCESSAFEVDGVMSFTDSWSQSQTMQNAIPLRSTLLMCYVQYEPLLLKYLKCYVELEEEKMCQVFFLSNTYFLDLEKNNSWHHYNKRRFYINSISLCSKHMESLLSFPAPPTLIFFFHFVSIWITKSKSEHQTHLWA